MKKLILPGVSFTVPSREIDLMVAGGRAPEASWLAGLDFYEKLWAVDRGADICIASGIHVDSLIGDCDSAKKENWCKLEEEGVEIFRFPSEKDMTDFQLALEIFSEKKEEGRELFISGAFGGRFDHLWSLFISAVSDKGARPLCMADDREGILFLEGKAEAEFDFDKIPGAFSLISFSESCSGVCADGVKWKLENSELDFNNPYAISNEVVSSEVKVSLEKGLLGVYWVWRV